MTNPDTVFDAIAAPVYAGVAIILLLSVRQVEIRKEKRAASRGNRGAVAI